MASNVTVVTGTLARKMAPKAVRWSGLLEIITTMMSPTKNLCSQVEAFRAIPNCIPFL
jgi:hypothetical protein